MSHSSPHVAQAPMPQPISTTHIKSQVLVMPKPQVQMRNVKSQARPNTLSKSVTVRVNTAPKETQTGIVVI